MDNGEEEEGIDRLSYLPDHVRDHILYFLDTKYSVQTSMLSTRWRSLWKHATHLNLDRDSFPTYPSFKTFLKQAFDTFGAGIESRIVKLSYKDRDLCRREHLRDLDTVMEHVASHPHIRHVSVHGGPAEMSPFSNLVAAFLYCDLDTLELGRVSLCTKSDWWGFRILQNLVLEDCSLDCDGGKDVDYFAKFPSLKNLVLSGCDLVHYGRRWFKISGPQLVKLEIHGAKNLGGLAVEIDAPKLRSLSFVFVSNVPNFSRLSLPVLDHAYLGSKFAPHSGGESRGTVAANLVNLLQGLHNATSLRFDHHMIEAMTEISNVLKHEACPFTRLKCLTLPCSVEPYFMSDQLLIDYFLGGSSSTVNPPTVLVQFD